MSTLKTTNLQESNASGANIVLGTGSGGGATISGVTTSSTLRATTGIVTTATITTSRTTTGIVTTFTATNSTFAGDVDPSANGVYDIGASNKKFKQIFVNNIDASAGVVTAKAFVPSEGQTSHRNLIINGAMSVAQRGTSSTSVGYVTIDRFNTDYGGENEAMTYTQHALTSSDTGPWAEGFRHSFHVQNGNQTGGAGAGDYVFVRTKLEAQDLSTSGWNYTSSSSYITLSFWVKSSVAQNFYGRLESPDGTTYNYPFETGSLTANTWKKITKTIPGNSNLTINNDNGSGMEFHWQLFRGTNFTDSGVALNTWATYASGTRTPDATSTWWTTNDATWELTGVQLEVGSVATPFEHRSYGDQLKLCKRYYQQYPELAADGYAPYPGSGAAIMTTTTAGWAMNYDTMRAAPTVSWSGNHRMVELNTDRAVTGFAAYHGSASTGWMVVTASGGGMTAGNAAIIGRNNDTSAYVKFDAEL